MAGKQMTQFPFTVYHHAETGAAILLICSVINNSDTGCSPLYVAFRCMDTSECQQLSNGNCKWLKTPGSPKL